MKQFVDLQDQFESVFIFIADYHALNFIQNKEEMQESILNLAIDYLAIGLNPQKVILYQQSRHPEHAELAWIFDTLTPMSYLERAHAYKDALAKGSEISVGTFNYPMLMAADILLYDTHVVPVGKDQKQHIEFARDTAEKFNRVFGETFVVPEAYILEDVQTVPGTDGQKMSKSYGNTIPLFASREEIEKAVMGIVTSSDGGRPENVYAIHALIKPEAELGALYNEHAGKYKVLKEALIEDLDAFIKPLRERRAVIAADIAEVQRILDRGAVVAHGLATTKMQLVRERIGVTL